MGFSPDQTRAEAIAAADADSFEQLSRIEFDGASDIQHYVRMVRDISKRFALELEFAAEDLEARLRSVPPATEEETGMVLARKAMRVSKHLKRSSEAAKEVGKNATKTWASLKTHFEAQMGGQEAKVRPKKTIDLES
ncbi:hypothetical protein [Streptomonospora nanhaiensis]|uniref:hypothetical protein n=1 Tax=Streptomonospora nanhaiensis TaxID=1323731 RepID=UPI001C3824BB|nr:hypothetical protein [Streptomonospora nanhaiensis]MBV2367114.1 hypothetical protein [Streptomonospora nanhaiensis]